MSIINYLNKPEYFFRPKQIFHRISCEFKRNKADTLEVVLPWGIKIRIFSGEAIGHAIWTTGLYDLSVTEMLWRLIDPGDIAIDVGANIGYMSSVMMQRVGPAGKVLSFEPHPELYQRLADNVKLWKEFFPKTHIQVEELALSDYSGGGFLIFPEVSK